MRGSRFGEEQVLKAVQRLEAGEDADALRRELHVSEQTLNRWRWKYGGVLSEERRLVIDLERQIHELRAELRRVNLENEALRDLIQKKA